MIAERTDFFVSGGTLPADAESYVERAADAALLSALTFGKFCYVLNSRQMGKSSMCIRTMGKLRETGVRSAMVDFTKIGGRNVTAEQWYAGILAEVGRALGLREPMMAYWKDNAALSGVQRLFGALCDVVLEKFEEPLVVFFDEIDATRSLSFSADEFFAAIRECYNRRVQAPVYKRLTFCLLGVAVPSDLISNPTSTPFNIGERIYLKDFTPQEAMALSKGIPHPSAESLVERVFSWTNGHPYLTQSLCQAIAADESVRTPHTVDALVARELFEPKARQTNINLADVANRALHAGDLEADPEKFRANLLSAYEKAWRGKPIADDESNRVAALLKLSGMMRSEDNQLRVRNRIYERVFDKAWIRENMPGQELRRQKRAFRIGAIRVAAGAVIVISLITYLAVRNAQLAEESRALAAKEREARQASDKLRAQAERFSYRAYAVTLGNANAAFEAGEHGKALEILLSLEQQPQRGPELSYLAARLHRFGRFLQTHPESLVGLTFLRNGNLVTVGPEGSIALWDSKTGQLFQRISTYRTMASARAGIDNEGDRSIVACSSAPDSRHIGLGFLTGKVAWFDFATRRVLWTATGHLKSLSAVSVDPTGKNLVAFSGAANQDLVVLSTSDGHVVKRVPIRGPGPQMADWSPDGRYLAITRPGAYGLRVIRTTDWSVAWTANPPQFPNPGPEDAALDDLYCVRFARDGKHALVGTRAGRVLSFDLETGSRRTLAQTNSFWPGDLHQLPGDVGWASVTTDNRVRYWDRDFKGKPVSVQDRQTVWYAAVSPDGSHFATAGNDGGVMLWNTPTPTMKSALPGDAIVKLKRDGWACSFLDTSSDGTSFVLVQIRPQSGKALLSVHRATDGRLRWSSPCKVATGRPTLGSTGRVVAFAHDDPAEGIEVRNTSDGTQVALLKGSYPLAFSPDDTLLATARKTTRAGGPYFLLEIYRTDNWSKIASLDLGDARFIYGAAFRPDLKQIAVSPTDSRLYVINLQDGFKTVLHGHNNDVIALQYSVDGSRLYSSSFDGTLRIWDLAKRTAAKVVSMNGSAPIAFTLLDDGARIAVYSAEGLSFVDPATLKILLSTSGYVRSTYSRRGFILLVDGSAIYRLDAESVPAPSEPEF